MITGGRKQKAPTKAGAFYYNWCRKQESNLRPTHYESARAHSAMIWNQMA